MQRFGPAPTLSMRAFLAPFWAACWLHRFSLERSMGLVVYTFLMLRVSNEGTTTTCFLLRPKTIPIYAAAKLMISLYKKCKFHREIMNSQKSSWDSYLEKCAMIQ